MICIRLVRILVLLAILFGLFSSRLVAQHVPAGPVWPHSAGAAPVWAFVQDAVSTVPCTVDPCPVTLASPTTAGSVLVAALNSTVTTDTITVVTGGGGTWNLCSGCQNPNTVLGGQDLAYNTTGTGGVTEIDVQDSAGNPRFVAVIEIKCTANCGTIALDAVPSTLGNSTSCATCTLAAFTGLTGTSDAFIQFANYEDGPISSPSGGYVIAPSTIFVYKLNSSIGTAPTVAQTAAGNFIATGLAIK